MASDVTVKRKDTFPPITTTLENLVAEVWTPINLTGAVKVKFIAKITQGNTVIEGTCAIVNAANGQISYTFAAGDTNTAGQYNVEFEIEWSATKIQTVPNEGYRELAIQADLGGA